MRLWPLPRWLRWSVGIVAGIAIVTAAGLFGALFYLDYRFNAPGPDHSDRAASVIEFERGLGLEAIALRLKDAEIITNAFVFQFGVWRGGNARALRAGEYAIPPRASMQEVMALLRDGKVVLHSLTIPEGLTTRQALRVIDADPVLDKPITEGPGEGALLPDTYHFPRGMTRDEIIRLIGQAQNRLVAELWANRDPTIPLKSPAEAVILASIVEKETGLAEERPRVAAVFINRLKRGMKLQSDPTIIYGITGGEPLGRGIRQSEIDRPTPYNTYQIDGLPPTPIANPGRDALAAVLNPPHTKELYFVADGSGGHAFAETLAEHNRNRAQWERIKAERARNGR